MYCINCGAKLVDDANFCHLCGHEVSAVPRDDEAEIEALREIEAIRRRLAELTNSDYSTNTKENSLEEMATLEIDEMALPELEDIEKELFGETEYDSELETTKKIDRFYTLFRKNEEFQKLLDEEYSKLKEFTAQLPEIDEETKSYQAGSAILEELTEESIPIEDEDINERGVSIDLEEIIDEEEIKTNEEWLSEAPQQSIKDMHLSKIENNKSIMHLKEKDFFENYKLVKTFNPEITIDYIKGLIKTYVDQYNLPISIIDAEVKVGSLVKNIKNPAIVLVNTEHANDYYKFAVSLRRNAGAIFISCDTFGKSKNSIKLANKSAAGNVLKHSFKESWKEENSSTAAQMMTLGGVIAGAKALKSIGGSKAKQQEEFDYYDIVKTVLDEVIG